MTTKSLAACVSGLALCLVALSACGGVTRGDKKAGAAGGAPGAGAAGTNAGDLFGGAGRASNVAGASTAAEGGAAGVGVDGNTEGGVGAAAPDAGNFACGASTCTANQICVQRQCGGGPVQCMAETDGGCPTGWHADACASGQFGQQTACVPDPCTPPPAECTDIPAACEGALNCFCINQASVCQGPPCQSIAGRQVTCAGAE